MVIIVTDGIPTRNEEQATPEAQILQDTGVKIYAIGITKFIDESILKSFSSQPQTKDNNYFMTPDFAGLENILQGVLRSTCGGTPTPPGNTKDTTCIINTIYGYRDSLVRGQLGIGSPNCNFTSPVVVLNYYTQIALKVTTIRYCFSYHNKLVKLIVDLS